MSQPRSALRPLLFALPLAFAGSPALAQDSDLEFVSTLSVAIPVSERVTGTVELSPRFRADRYGADHQLMRATLDVEAAKGLSVGGGVAYDNRQAADEFRLHQQLTYTTGRLSFRTRLEERDFDGAPRIGLRLRERAQYTWPLAKAMNATLGGELLYTLQTTNPADPQQVDEIRAFASVQCKLSPALAVSAGYMGIYEPKPRREDRYINIPLLGLSLKL